MTIVNDRSLSGNDISVYLSPQTTKGAIDASPVFDPFRRTEGKAKKEIAYVSSSEVKSNRQGRTQVQDTITYTGALSFELSQDSAKYLDGLIHGTATDNDITASITIAATALGFTSSAEFAALSVGDWFKASGFTNPLLNTYYKVSVFTDSSTIETEVAPVATEIAGASVTLESTKTSSGSDQTYYTTQTRTVDKAAAGDIDYRTFYDAVINTGTIEVGETGIVTGGFELNIEQLLAGVAIVSGQADNAADGSDPVSAVNNISAIYVDGVNSNCGVKSFGIDFNNNYQGDRAAGCEGESYAFGDVESTGALVTRAVISNTFDWRNKFEASTPFALACVFTWADGRWMVVEIMRAKLTEHSMPDASNVISSNEMSYSAEEDPITNKTVQIFRNF